MKRRRLYYVIMPFIMALTLIVSLFAPLVPTNLSSAAVISDVTGLSANDAIVTRKSDNKDFTGDDDTDPYTAYIVSYNWSIPNDVGEIKNDDTFTFELPSNVKYNGGEITVKNESGTQIVGTATIKGSTGTVTITNADALGRTDRKGTVEVYANGTSDNATHGWMIAKGGWSTKVGDEDRVQWQVMYNSTNEKLKNVVIIDTFSEGQKYVSGSYQVLTGTVDENNKFNATADITKDVKMSSDGNTLTFDIGNIDTAIEILYQTLPNKGFAGTLTNKATGSADGKGSASTNNIEVAWGGKGTADGYTASAELTKVDSKDSTKKLSGAEFKLVDADGSTIRTGLTTDENGKITVKDLAEGEYAFIETQAPTGYDLDATPHNFTIKKDGDNPVEVTAENTPTKPKTTSVTVNKEWNDSDNKDNLRPDSVKVQLYKTVNGETEAVDGKTATLSESNNWKTTFGDLAQVDSDGNAITYSVQEVNVPDGYSVSGGTVSSDGQATLTNTHPAVTNITVNKEWDDFNNAEGKRPSSIKLQLYKNKEKSGDPVEVKPNDSGDWTHTFENLPKVDSNNNEITYSVQEVDVPDGYTSNASDPVKADTNGNVTITNAYTPANTSVTVNKDWVGDENYTAFRVPINVQLYKVESNGNEVAVGEPVQIDGRTDSNWSYTWNNLQKYNSDGTEIKYTVKETTDLANYTEGDPVQRGNTFTITNTYAPELTTLTVNKAWDDNNDQDGIRPDSVKVQLYKTVDGKTEAVNGKTVTLSDSNQWVGTFKDLNKYDENGKEITYSVKEVNDKGEAVDNPVSGYDKPSYDTSKTGEVKITNTHTPETTSLTVNKVWKDNNDQDGKRPDSVTVKLLANGNDTGKTVTLSNDNNWSASFDKLDKKDSNGNAIRYSVQEDVPKGYISSASGAVDVADGGSVTITNTPTTDINVTKSWQSDENYTAFRKPVEVQLLANGKPAAGFSNITLSESNKWENSFTNLPKYDSEGNKIPYSVKEVTKLSNYESQVGSVDENGNVTITNTYQPTQITVTKDWNDNDDQDGIRPKSINVTLYRKTANDTEKTAVETKTITPDSEGKWTTSFTNLPKTDADGNEFEYSLGEEKVDGYTTEFKMSGNEATITNTHTPKVTSLTVNKVWKDNNDQDGKRPDSVQVQLYKSVNGEQASAVEGKTVTLNKENSWKASFTNLPVYENGQKITYSVKEVNEVPGYTEEDGDVDTTNNTVTITNTHNPATTSLTVNKVWKDVQNVDKLRPKQVNVKLYQDGNPTDKTITLNADNDWKGEFSGLPVYQNGKQVTYSVKEVNDQGKAVDNPVSGYDKPSYDTSETGEVKITNTHTPETTELTVNKEWADDTGYEAFRKDVTVQLYKNGVAFRDPITLSTGNNWNYTFKNLPKNDENGEIKYTVKETNTDKLPNYTASVGEVEDNQVTITNTFNPIELTVNKIWKDNNNQDGKQAKSVTIHLLASGKDTGKSVVLSAKNNWTASFTSLNKYDENGNEITYSVNEDAVDGYKTTISELKDGKITVTNTHTPATTSLTVNKIWKDDNNSGNTRPKEIKVTLYGNGEPTGYTVTLNAKNNWQATFNDIPVYANGDVITYSVKEEKVTGYNTSYKAVGNAINITNTLTEKPTSKTTHLTVNKVWKDNNNKEKLRPSEITVKLLANGKDTGKSMKLSAKNNWQATFSDLAKKDKDGKEITYTAEEVLVDEYISKVSEVKDNAVTITNTLIPNTPPVKPTTPPNKPDKPNKPNKPDKPTSPTTPPVKPTKTPEKDKSVIDKLIDQILPQTGESKNHTTLTYVGLLVILVVIISWGIVIIRKRKNK